LLLESQQQMKEKNQELERFASIVTHDIKSPLVKLSYAVNTLDKAHQDVLDKDASRLLGIVKSSSGAIGQYVDDLLAYYTSDRVLSEEAQQIAFGEILTELDAIAIRDEAELIADQADEVIHVNKAALMQILVNLATNSLKYNNKKQKIIWLSVEVAPDQYEFIVKDNGIGIPEDQLSDIFDMFYTCERNDINDDISETGTGLGLATVHKLVNRFGGNINVTSEVGEGSEFRFTLKKYPQPKSLVIRES